MIVWLHYTGLAVGESIMFDNFYTRISEIIDKHIPKKKLSRRELKLRTKSWITPALKVSICIKNKLYKKYLKLNQYIITQNLNIIGIKSIT